MALRLNLISARRMVAVLAMTLALTAPAAPARAQGGSPGPGPQGGTVESEAIVVPRGSLGDSPESRATDGRSRGGGLGKGGSPGSLERNTFPALGASGTLGFDNVPGNQSSPLGGRLGPTGLRAPAASLQPPTSGKGPGSETNRRLEPPEANPGQLPQLQRLQRLEIPAGPEDPGPPDGLTLDAAIAMLLGRNLELMALQYEIPKAEADILTAGLRSNPIFYADTQFVPYGGYSERRPGRRAVLELESQVLPASRRARDDAYRGFQEDQKEVNDYIDKQKDHVDNVREYRDALVEHRRSMLRLNTAVAARLLP